MFKINNNMEKCNMKTNIKKIILLVLLTLALPLFFSNHNMQYNDLPGQGIQVNTLELFCRKNEYSIKTTALIFSMVGFFGGLWYIFRYIAAQNNEMLRKYQEDNKANQKNNLNSQTILTEKAKVIDALENQIKTLEKEIESKNTEFIAKTKKNNQDEINKLNEP
jgi:uncharacterized protein HemX